jgi:flagellar biosynthesis protein FliQ
METELFLEITNKALFATGVLSLPILIPGLIAGIIISIFQAVTQINEQTLTFVPKLFILIISYLVTGPWLVRFMTGYTSEVFTRIPEIANPLTGF